MSSQIKETASFPADKSERPDSSESTTPAQRRDAGYFSMDNMAARGFLKALSLDAARALTEQRNILAAQEAELHQRIEQIDSALPSYLDPEL